MISKDWFTAADAFRASIELNPDHRYAGAMHWLISYCYEKLKDAKDVDVEEADAMIEWGYQTLFDKYPSDRDVAYAAVQLGRFNLARGRPVSACVYFNWYMDNAHANDGQIPEISRILEGLEGCGQ